jgi:hypothetical protein
MKEGTMIVRWKGAGWGSRIQTNNGIVPFLKDRQAWAKLLINDCE